MDAIFRRVFMFVLGITLGYCTGFNDAAQNDHMIHIRAIERVQDFGKSTLGDRERRAEDALRP